MNGIWIILRYEYGQYNGVSVVKICERFVSQGNSFGVTAHDKVLTHLQLSVSNVVCLVWILIRRHSDMIFC